VVEPRNGDEISLRVDADVGRAGNTRDDLGHGAVLHDVNGAIGPARDENAAVAQDLDAVVLAWTRRQGRRRLVAVLPDLYRAPAEWREQPTPIRAVPCEPVRRVERVRFDRGAFPPADLEDLIDAR